MELQKKKLKKLFKLLMPFLFKKKKEAKLYLNADYTSFNKDLQSAGRTFRA